MRIPIAQPEVVTRWRSGLRVPIAVLPYTTEQLLRRYAIEFTTGADDLDTYQIAFIELHPGQQAMLLEYRDDESGGITVSVDSEDDIADAETRLLRLFNLRPADMVWLKSTHGERAHA